MKKYLPLTVFAALIYAGQSLGGAINYNYFELGYLEADWDDTAAEDADGYEFNLSLGVAQTVALELGYQDIESSDGEANLQGIGIAYHKPYSATGDMIFSLTYLNQEIESDNGGTFDESGNAIRLEIRNQNNIGTEYSFALLRNEIDGESDSGYGFSVVTGNPQGFQFVLDYVDMDDISSLMLGLRSGF
ncbi:MAG: hypothetical protein GY802_08325 [Gammaproteobacteria bacterium]|nr:hypothetical protein [Gammaproteobacteria bacterium]